MRAKTVKPWIETAIIPSRRFVYSIYPDHTWSVWECIVNSPSPHALAIWSFTKGAEVACSGRRCQSHLNAKKAVAKAIARLEKAQRQA